MSVSIIIKALNEEMHIAAAIESALAGLAAAGLSGTEGEVILADGGSTDRTVAIASGYPIKIAKLSNPSERSCGVGPQLGFQYAKGDHIALIDGDMVLSPHFLREGLACLDAHPAMGGVSGLIREMRLTSIEFERRQKRVSPELMAGPVDRLNAGGLYRRAAIESVGVLSDRNLHAYEEFELGSRLRFAGWTMLRLPTPFVDHYGHTTGGYKLLWRRYTSRYLFGIGEVLRGALGRPHFRATLRALPEVRLWLGVYAGWLAACLALVTIPSVALAFTVILGLALAPIATLALRYRSIKLGVYAFVAWNAHAVGMAFGFLRPRVPADLWIASHVIDGSVMMARAPASAPSRPDEATGLFEAELRHV